MTATYTPYLKEYTCYCQTEEGKEEKQRQAINK